MSMLLDIEKDLPNVVWKEEPLTEGAKREDPTMKSYVGTSSKLRILVVSFDVSSQGFPKGWRGYDGTAIQDGKVVHLTRELAEKALKAAETR